MNERINFKLANYEVSELHEAIVAAKYDTAYQQVHRETIEQHFVSLGRELGFRVEPVNAPALEAAE
jgi:hypothetical protein